MLVRSPLGLMQALMGGPRPGSIRSPAIGEDGEEDEGGERGSRGSFSRPSMSFGRGSLGGPSAGGAGGAEADRVSAAEELQHVRH